MINKEKFIPVLESKQIGPEIELSKQVTEKRREQREGEKSLSQYILKWWKGDAHTHSKESNWENLERPESVYDLEEIMHYYEKLGLQFVCFAEHASNPLAPQKQLLESSISRSLLNEAERITQLNQENKRKIIVLSGVETSIHFNEKDEAVLDLPDEVLQKMDLVIASRHVIKNERQGGAIEQSLMVAVENNCVDVIGHPDRGIRYYPSDWNYFCYENPEARKIKEKIRKLKKEPEKNQSEIEKLYLMIDKIIGKKPIEEEDDELTKKLYQKFEEMGKGYWTWDMWERILDRMKEKNKAFEINLNNPPDEKLVKMAVEREIKFFINFDAHDFDRWKKEQTEIIGSEEAKKRWVKGEASEEDLEILKEYKMDRLSSGPGSKAILRLVRWLKRLEGCGVTPDRIINSSKENLLRFLTEERKKTTENLTYLTKRDSEK